MEMKSKCLIIRFFSKIISKINFFKHIFFLNVNDLKRCMFIFFPKMNS